MKNSETPLFFQNGDYRLFGVLHRPDQQPAKRAFVFCHPFAEEKLWTHRVYVSFARELASRGYAVLRFDHYGHGDSEGYFREATIKHYKSDIEVAIAYLKSQIPELVSIGLLGQRFGATLAADITESRDDINQLVLWDPVMDGASYMQEVLRINLTTQMAVYGEVSMNREALVEQMKAGNYVNVDGYQMSYTMFEGASATSLDGGKKYQGPCLAVQMSKKQQPIKKNLQELADSYSQGDVRLALEAPFWREIKESYFRAPSLFKVTLKWLEEQND